MKSQARSNSGYLIVISAPSGAGKTTLCKRLLDDFPSVQLSISCTTRAPRGQEQNGKEYFFITADQFKKGIDRGEFAEWAQVHDNYYGTRRDQIDQAFQLGKSVLLDIDVQGADQIHRIYGERCYRVFVSPPNMETLEERLRSRKTDSEETIQKRLRNARTEMAQKDHFDHILINDDLDRAYVELKSLLQVKLHLTPKARS